MPFTAAAANGFSVATNTFIFNGIEIPGQAGDDVYLQKGMLFLQSLEFLHAVNECLNAFLRTSIVDRCTESAH